MSEDKKYTSQQKHLRTKYVRFPLDLKPESWMHSRPNAT